MMAAVYGYPKGAKQVPGLVQIHGGGGSGTEEPVLANAKEGYATISIAWAASRSVAAQADSIRNVVRRQVVAEDVHCGSHCFRQQVKRESTSLMKAWFDSRLSRRRQSRASRS